MFAAFLFVVFFSFFSYLFSAPKSVQVISTDKTSLYPEDVFELIDRDETYYSVLPSPWDEERKDDSVKNISIQEASMSNFTFQLCLPLARLTVLETVLYEKVSHLTYSQLKAVAAYLKKYSVFSSDIKLSGKGKNREFLLKEINGKIQEHRHFVSDALDSVFLKGVS